MPGRIVEIADDCRHLSLSRGFLVVQETDGERRELGAVPLDDIAALVANAHGLSYTNNVLVALAERGVPFVLCGPNHNVVGMLLPAAGHHTQARRFDAQIAARRPLLKRTWADLVRAKIRQQAAVLDAAGGHGTHLNKLAPRVRSGDPENLEAQAARHYWSQLFGESFRRDRAAGGLNALLNYGYAVLRACIARSVVAAGLHPTIGIHHRNEANPMRLVDDLMEPFRPVMDLKVWKLAREGVQEVTPAAKRALVHTLYEELGCSEGTSPLMLCAQRLATSYAQLLLGERERLDLPLPGLPVAMSGSLDDAA